MVYRRTALLSSALFLLWGIGASVAIGLGNVPKGIPGLANIAHWPARGAPAGDVDVEGAGRFAPLDDDLHPMGAARRLHQADLEEAKSRLQHMIGNHGDTKQRLRVERVANVEEVAAMEDRKGRRHHKHRRADGEADGGDPGQADERRAMPEVGSIPAQEVQAPMHLPVPTHLPQAGALNAGALEYAVTHGVKAERVSAQFRGGQPSPPPPPPPLDGEEGEDKGGDKGEGGAGEDDGKKKKKARGEVAFVPTIEPPEDVEDIEINGLQAWTMQQELEFLRKEVNKYKGKAHGLARDLKIARKELNRVQGSIGQVMTAALVAHNTATECGCPVTYDVPDIGPISTADITNMVVENSDNGKGRLLQALAEVAHTLRPGGKPLHPDSVGTLIPAVMSAGSEKLSKSEAAAENLEALKKGARTLFRGLVPRIPHLMMWANTPGVPVAPVRRMSTCALVGNAQRMLLQKNLGEEINAHDAVLRLNQAPTAGFEKWVGNFTTWRLINAHWADIYRRNKKLALEPNCTVMVTRTQSRQYSGTASALKRREPTVGTVMMERRATDGAGDFLRALKSRLDLIRGMPYAGKGSPSSGFLGTWLLLQLCDSVDVYGVGLGSGTSWHYFHQGNFVSSREFSEAPHHSFELESAVLQMLDAVGLIRHRIPTDVELTDGNGDKTKDLLSAVMKEGLESAGRARKDRKRAATGREDGDGEGEEGGDRDRDGDGDEEGDGEGEGEGEVGGEGEQRPRDQLKRRRRA